MKQLSGTGTFLQCPIPIQPKDTVQLAHGSGGRLMNQLIEKMFVSTFGSPVLAQMGDSAVLDLPLGQCVFSTDSYVVDPLFFPGGNIGELAVNGTVNDLCMSGAVPKVLSVGFILEEGLSLETLWEIVRSMKEASDQAGVQVVTGDTKVVNRGKADKIFINTSGIGVITQGTPLSPSRIEAGDKVILSGTLADHGLAVLSKREGFSFESPILSDTAALNSLTSRMMATAGSGLHAMRDPTRGGLASVLNELAAARGVGIRIDESKIPVNASVVGACELLGLDPLYVANEGKLVAFASPEAEKALLEVMREHPLGANAVTIGRVEVENPGLVSMRTLVGGSRIVDMLAGEQLPRIC